VITFPVETNSRLTQKEHDFDPLVNGILSLLDVPKGTDATFFTDAIIPGSIENIT
jgi:hypothetical protein